MPDLTRHFFVKWPFLLADALLLTTAYLIYREGERPMGFALLGLIVLCVAGGAFLSIVPFLLEYWVLSGLPKTRELTADGDQMQKLAGLLRQITALTQQTRAGQEDLGETVAAAKDIAERFGAELRCWTEIPRPVNGAGDNKTELAGGNSSCPEDERVQALVQMLDHVFALHVGALRSGQPTLIQQISHFQDACRGAARRIGLTPFIAEPAEPFDAQRHQQLDFEAPVSTESKVSETIAAGYMFKGRLLRPALVRLSKSGGIEQSERLSTDSQNQPGPEARDSEQTCAEGDTVRPVAPSQSDLVR